MFRDYCSASKMAASGVEFDGWRTLLKDHYISKYLKKLSQCGTSRQQNKDTKNLICIKSSDLFVWCASEGCILHCNLKALSASEENGVKTESESTTPESNFFGAAGSDFQSNFIQVSVLLSTWCFSLNHKSQSFLADGSLDQHLCLLYRLHHSDVDIT